MSLRTWWQTLTSDQVAVLWDPYARPDADELVWMLKYCQDLVAELPISFESLNARAMRIYHDLVRQGIYTRIRWETLLAIDLVLGHIRGDRL